MAGCWSVVNMSREQIIADCADAASSALDEAAMRLSLLGAFCWLGWNQALDAAEHPDASCERRERQDLDWWVQLVRWTLNAGLL